MALLLLRLLMITVCLYVIIPFTGALSFNFTSFSPNDKNITYEKGAYPAEQIIQLTNNQKDQPGTASMGRATYDQPLQLWENSTGNLTDFDTHFSFVIDSRNNSEYGDGLAFFLAPQGSKIPDGATKGGTLGLTTDAEQYVNSTENRFVAVVFDIFDNFLNRPGEHVSININSMKSIANVTWSADIMGGRRNEAWIRYNSTTHNLTVAFTGFRSNLAVMQYLSCVIDLRIYLPERVTFGFSAATGNNSAIHSIFSWNFTSSLQNIDHNITAPPPASNGNRRRRKDKTGIAVGLGVAGALICISALVWLGTTLMGQKKLDEEEEDCNVIEEDMEDDFQRGMGPKKFSYMELARATNNFKVDEKLGEGGFGGVYKGFLRDMNAYVAVKRVSRGSNQGIKEYASEVKIISRLRHRNLVQLIGWCHERKELLLVYEFMPNGSLDSRLFKEKSLLSWDVRYKIAQGLASGLLYLHQGWEQCVVHRDIKSSNIMLDSDFNAKLGDFGLARLVDHGKGSQTTVLAGTMGYMAPECATTGKASKESDVYSFGVVALEIACGRKPIDPKAREGQINLVEWVWGLCGEGQIFEAADPKLSGDFVQQQMERLMMVGLWCAHPDEKLRPTIQQAIHVLNFDAPSPVLPSRMPVPTYYAPPLSNFPSFSPSYAGTDFGVGPSQVSSYSYSTNSSQFTASSKVSSSPSASLLFAPS